MQTVCLLIFGSTLKILIVEVAWQEWKGVSAPSLIISSSPLDALLPRTPEQAQRHRHVVAVGERYDGPDLLGVREEHPYRRARMVADTDGIEGVPSVRTRFIARLVNATEGVGVRNRHRGERLGRPSLSAQGPRQPNSMANNVKGLN